MPLWRRGRVARQRPAKPRTAVRVRSSPSPRVWPRRLAGGPSPPRRALVPLAALHSAARAVCTVPPRCTCQRHARRVGRPGRVRPRRLAGGPSPPRRALVPLAALHSAARAVCTVPPRCTCQRHARRVGRRHRVWPVVLALLALVVAACGTQEQSEPAEQLVPQLSDLPAGFNLVPAESFPIPTSKILAETPSSASSAAIIRRERLSGYQAGVHDPNGAPHRVQRGALSVERICSQGLSVADAPASPAFVAETGWTLAPGREDRRGDRCLIDSTSVVLQYLGVAWRYRDVLSTCVGGGSTTTSPMAEILVVARAQQRRIATELARGRLGRRWQEREDPWALPCSAPGLRG